MSNLYVSDLDGTLLRSNEVTSKYTNQVINSLVEEGMIFSYATARSLVTAKKVTEGINAKIPLIVYNGAFVIDNITEKILIANYFDDSVHLVLEDLFSNNVYPIVYAYIDNVCAGTGCIASGSMKVYENLRNECQERGLSIYVGLTHHGEEEKSLHIKMSGCHGFCEMGCLVHIEPLGVMYVRVKPEDCHEIVERTLLGGEIIERLTYHQDGISYPRQVTARLT